MKKRIVFILLSLPLFSLAQGIKFEEGLTWEQIKAKAKAENKYIFVDCYATWCGPCKLMDKNVYPDEEVGKRINGKFISVKVQMDTSKKDDNNIKSWYSDASELKIKYAVTAFPTFLFFSSEGLLVHRALGYKNSNGFIDLASSASNPQKQFYTLLDDYKSGNKNYLLFPYMMKAAKQVGENDWVQVFARDYLDNILYKQKKNDLLVKEKLIIIGSYMQSSSEIGFRLFFRNQRKIDKIVGIESYTRKKIEAIIYSEYLKPAISEVEKTMKDPDWSSMYSSIQKKYGTELSHRVILSGKLNWYRRKGDWDALAKYNIEKIEKFGLDTAGLAKSFSNNMIWDVFFLHCNNLEQLNKAIGWMEIIRRIDPYDANSIDTYANLLYKAGRLSEAAKFEKIAVKLLPDNKQMQVALENMENGEPTYLKEGAIWNSNTMPKLIKSKTEPNNNNFPHP